jgi:hypothetical protein
MGIRDWIKEWAAREPEEEDRFIEVESPSIVHRDPQVRAMLAEIDSIKKELHRASWKMYQLQSSKSLSQFERYKLRKTQEEFERLVKLYRSKELELRELQNRAPSKRPRSGNPLRIV